MSADRRLSSTGASAARIAHTQQEGTTEEEGNDAARNSPHPCCRKYGSESVWPLRERLTVWCVCVCRAVSPVKFCGAVTPQQQFLPLGTWLSGSFPREQVSGDNFRDSIEFGIFATSLTFAFGEMEGSLGMLHESPCCVSREKMSYH